MSSTQQENRDVLIDRYLNGKLTAAEHAAFEIRLLDEPFLLEQVQIAEAMKAALHRDKAALLRAPRTDAQQNPLVFFGKWFGQWLQQPMSMAATVLVALLGWQVAQTRLAEAPVINAAPAVATSSSSLAIASVVQLESSRGVTAAHFSGTAPYLFKLDAGLGNEASAYAFALRDAQQHDVLAQSGLKADAEGWVQLVITNKLAGEYSATLSWTDQSGASQQRSFPIVID